MPAHSPQRHNASPSERAIDGVFPVSVARPSSEEALSELVAEANRGGLALFPWGGGSRILLGNPPRRAGIVVETGGLNRVVTHNSADLTATFQAGVTMRRVSETLARAGQLLAIDSPLPDSATVGGILAAGVSGPTRWQFGHPRDTVIGMKVVQADGAITKSGGQVVKNVSGYDMSRLHIGGLGSLGIILEASFKLTPIPMYESALVGRFADIGAAMGCALDVFNSRVTPLAISGLDGSAANAVGLGDGRGEYVAFRLGGRPRTLDRQVDEVSEACRRAGALRVEQVDGVGSDKLWRAISDFGWGPDRSAALNLRVTTTPSRVERVHDMIGKLGSERMEASVVSQPGFGVVEASWFETEPSVEDEGAGELAAIVRKVRDGSDTLGGVAIVQKCPTAVKRIVDVWGGDPPGIGVMRRLKEQYDPNDIMNPGRYVGGI